MEQAYISPMSPNDLLKALDGIKVLKNNKGIAFYNCPCAFDIETSSFYDNNEKVAIMYEWTLGINGAVMIGRTWSEFQDIIQFLVDKLNLNERKRLVLYVHNLSFEFGFLEKRFEWSRVFALEQRKPIIATTIDGIEFRCSYLLSGYSLAKVGEHLQKYKVNKKVGDLDYKLIRHSKTPLSETEIGYCVSDVQVVMNYIKEEIERNGSIIKIPMTKTGYVRRFCRNSCFKSKENKYKRFRYLSLIHVLTLTPEVYKQLKNAFQGGFTHANPFSSGKVIENVSSIDFTSSYPAVLVSERFPMSAPEKYEIKDKEDFEKQLRLYCCLFDIRIYGLKSRIFYDSYLSLSRCRDVRKPQINNGRLVSADYLETTITEQDFFIIREFYTWNKIEVGNFNRFRRGYLPKDFVKAILELYKMKTELKGVIGQETEYLRGKEMLNSCY